MLSPFLKAANSLWEDISLTPVLADCGGLRERASQLQVRKKGLQDLGLCKVQSGFVFSWNYIWLLSPEQNLLDMQNMWLKGEFRSTGLCALKWNWKFWVGNLSDLVQPHSAALPFHRSSCHGHFCTRVNKNHKLGTEQACTPFFFVSQHLNCQMRSELEST